MERNMPVKTEKPVAFRPSQEYLDIFWALAEGDDDQRAAAVIKIIQLIDGTLDVEERKNVMCYCRERLVRGLSSGRKFARIGFSTALTQLLSQYEEIETQDVLTTVKEKLRIVRHEKKSKSEVGGIYLGRVFAFSSLIQADRIKKGEMVKLVVEELLNMAEKKSYLKSVCSKTLQDLVARLPEDVFGEEVWPRVRDKLIEGWEGCTLDRLALLLLCAERFPNIVNKKFIKKHWGYPLLGAENDENVTRAIMESSVKSEIMFETVLPKLRDTGRDALSIWNKIGARLMESLPEKRLATMHQRQILGLQLVTKLVDVPTPIDQVLDLVCSPTLSTHVFHYNTRKNDLIAVNADVLCGCVCERLREEAYDVLMVIERLMHLESSSLSGNKQSKLAIVGSQNFAKILNMLSREQISKFTDTLMAVLKGDDQWDFLSSNAAKKEKQEDWCLRQLQHIVCSQQHTTQSTQKDVLSLFLRLAYFCVEKKNKKVQHCTTALNLKEESERQKLCESMFFRCLDSLSTLKKDQQSRASQLSDYLDLLSHLAQYMQALMQADGVTPLKAWPEEMTNQWEKLLKTTTKIKQNMREETQNRDSAFLLLFLFLAFHMLTDFKTASELLQDVFICHKKAASGKTSKNSQDQEDPPWVEVVTEILLNLMSLPSHLGRVVTTTVFRSLVGYLTPESITLITEVLLPKNPQKDDAGGVFVEAEEEDSQEEGDDDDELLDEDVPQEESDDESGGEEDMEEENDDDDAEEEEEMTVDEKFRESVKKALGKAADVDEDDDKEEELPDLSDSEMFQLDEMLAEVFRQRRKAGGKKAREEQQKEMSNFRVRVLDLLEAMIKSERCGDFVLDLLKPLLLLIFKMKTGDNLPLGEKAKSLFHLLRSKVKGLSDSVHSNEEHKNFFQELIDLAQTVSEANHLNETATACYIVMNLTSSTSKKEMNQAASSSSSDCLALLKETVDKVISKKQNKPHLSFFTTLLELDPVRFHDLASMLLTYFTDSSAKPRSRLIACSLLSSLAKKTQNVTSTDLKTMRQWMTPAAREVAKLLLELNKEDIKVQFTKDLLTLAAALLTRADVLTEANEWAGVVEHLQSIKPKLNTDLRRLSHKVIPLVQRHLDQGSSQKKKKKKHKRAMGEHDQPPAKKMKNGN